MSHISIDEARIASALAPFGWTCTPEFWQRYHQDAWVFNLANAVDRLARRDARLTAALTDIANMDHTGSLPMARIRARNALGIWPPDQEAL